MNYMLTALLVLGAISLVAAVVLFVCSKRFKINYRENFYLNGRFWAK